MNIEQIKMKSSLCLIPGPKSYNYITNCVDISSFVTKPDGHKDSNFYFGVCTNYVNFIKYANY